MSDQVSSTHSERNRSEFGECWRAVEMETDYDPKTTTVEIIRRWPDGREEQSHSLKEQVADEFLTLKQAVARAVELHDAGKFAAVDHMPDGRGGHTGGFITVIGAKELRAVIEAARK